MSYNNTEQYEEIYNLLVNGEMSYDEFEYWISELRTQAVEDAEYAAAAYGY